MYSSKGERRGVNGPRDPPDRLGPVPGLPYNRSEPREDDAIRILIANNRYFVSGGPERYLFTVTRLLEQEGHTVVPFAMRYARNEPTPYSRHFTPPPLDEDQVYYADRRLSPVERLRLLGRVIYSPRVVRDARRAIRAERIDIVYTLNVAHFLHPGVVLAAHAEGVPVVSRLSDFYLLVPCYTMFRGVVCEECLRGASHALPRRCLKGSLAVTAARVAAMKAHALMGADRKVSLFLTPTERMRAKMIEAGHAPDRVVRIPTPVDFPASLPERERDPFFLFVGNVLEHKGLRELLGGLERVPDARLVVAGNADTDEGRVLDERVQSGALRGRVEFRGMVDRDELDDLYARARAVVIPSTWYENLPNVLLEAIAAGAPVLASNVGTLAETIEDGRTGLLFDPRNPEDVARALGQCAGEPETANAMARAAFSESRAVHAPEAHVRRLVELFGRAIGSPR